MKKKFSITHFVFNVVVGFLLAAALGINPAIGMSVMVGVGSVLSFAPPIAPMGLHIGLAKEIWTDVIKEGFYPDGSFLNESTDMTHLVEYNTINLAEAGIEPAVLRNNSIYPIPVSPRGDIPLQLPLNTFDTENTVVRNIEQIETSYDKMQSVVAGHRNALRKYCLREAAHNWAPGWGSPEMPILPTTGSVNPSTGFKRLTFEDIIVFDAKFRDLDVDMSEASICLSTQHLADLRTQDMKLYKEIMSDKRLYGFKVFTSSVTPVFNAGGFKEPFGSIPMPGMSDKCSFAWIKSEVMRADGDYDMFAEYKSPTERGDIIGFQKRFTALPIRNKYVGAIYTSF